MKSTRQGSGAGSGYAGTGVAGPVAGSRVASPAVGVSTQAKGGDALMQAKQIMIIYAPLL